MIKFKKGDLVRTSKFEFTSFPQPLGVVISRTSRAPRMGDPPSCITVYSGYKLVMLYQIYIITEQKIISFYPREVRSIEHVF
jgi:hypothetical protein